MKWYNYIFRLIPHKHSWKYSDQWSRECKLCGKSQIEVVTLAGYGENVWHDDLKERLHWWK